MHTGLCITYLTVIKVLGAALRPVLLRWEKLCVPCFASSCTSLFWYVCARYLHWLKHMNHRDTLSLYFHTQDWTHNKIQVFLGDLTTNQCSAEPQPEFGIKTSASASPLDVYSRSGWALDHSCSHSAVTLRHICPGQNANHLSALCTFVWWHTQKASMKTWCSNELIK